MREDGNLSDGTTSKIGIDATIDPGIDRSPYESVL